jgi:hypothetical protein
MKSLKNLWIAVRTTPPALLVLGIAAFVYLVAKIWVFDSMPEIFDHAYEFGRLVQNLLEATVAATVFFVLSFQLPSVIEQQRVGPAVYAFVDLVVARVILAFDRIYRNRPGHTVPAELPLVSITLKLVTEVFESVNPSDPCNALLDIGSLQAVQWIRSFTMTDQECRQYIDQIWRYGRFVDAEVAALISQIGASQYSRTLQALAATSVPLNSPNLGFLAPSYISVYGKAMRLAKCAEKMRKRYGLAKTTGG